MPTITQLKYIVAVDRLRHFGKAAKECNVSQPSLSMQIQKVEEELDFPIFDRNRKPILPTHKGFRFLEQAKAVLREHSRLVDIAKSDANEVSGDFTLGVIPTMASYVLPLFLSHFSQSYPKVHLNVEEMKTSDIIESLKEDKIDAGILATPLKESGIRERPIFYEPFYLYGQPVDGISVQKKISPSEVDPNNLWLLQEGHCFRNQVINYCNLKERKGVFGNVTFESGNIETLKNLVKVGEGYTLIPHLALKNISDEEQKKMVISFLPPIPVREVSLVFSRDQWKKDIVGVLIDTIKENVPEDLKGRPRDDYEVVEIS